MDDRSPEIESDPEEFQSFQSYDNSNETSRTVNTDQLGNFEVNPPGLNDFSPSDDDDNFENFHVEFGRGSPGEPSPPESRRITSVLEEASEVSEDYEEQVVDLEIREAPEFGDVAVTESLSENADTEEQVVDTSRDQEPQDVEVEESGEHLESVIADTLFKEDVEEQPQEELEEKQQEQFEDKQQEEDDQRETEERDEEQEKEVEDDLKHDTAVDKDTAHYEERVVPRTESSDMVSDVTTERSSARIEGGSVSSRDNLVHKDREPGPEMFRGRSDRESDKVGREREERREERREGEKRSMSTSALPHSVKRKYLTPAAVISQYAKGNLTNSEAMDAIMKFRVNKMLPKKVDGVYLDKEEVRIPKGYSFARHRGPGSKKKRTGLTRIEREIRAYQESTQMLIPRSIFARIVKEIAQGWFKGEGQIKFTVEALSALQVATEDEIIRLLEISTACSYHAKRITLRVDDMRLARFCRGRQNYEFSNIN